MMMVIIIVRMEIRRIKCIKIEIVALPFARHIALGKLLNFLKSVSSNKQKRENNTITQGRPKVDIQHACISGFY